MPKFVHYLSAIMALIYIPLGLYIAFSPSFSKVVQYPINVFFGILLVAYGAFRLYRAYISLVKERNE